jgi:hypothetical protein
MNMKPRKKLKIEFKQFQRLPEWPIIIPSQDAGTPINDTSVRKVGMTPLVVEQQTSGARSFAE